MASVIVRNCNGKAVPGVEVEVIVNDSDLEYYQGLRADRGGAAELEDTDFPVFLFIGGKVWDFLKFGLTGNLEVVI